MFYKSESLKGNLAPTLLLAHGAGAPADSMFMERLASALAEEGVTTLRFEFPYMQKRRQDGRKRPPDRQPVLLESFREAVNAVMAEPGSNSVFVGGKSMGGRMASLMIAQEDLHPAICGAVCFGYPFHPPGKGDRWRTDHFRDLQRPVQIIQGTRDPFGKRPEVEEKGVDSIKSVSLSWLEGGDHDYRPLARQPENHEQMIRQAARLAADFMRRCS
ncbi:alpha/beta fold hydrolase [Marinobacter sp. HL-58]|uniref:alpha/beta fold hydrolase n=1 Tax=Marinobacter sp. HL-58 TaxID=1479237 RepID=UPI00068E915C|nr:alpha/beta fold hydrolase [Marinobacter sp. HL-58]KPP98955.1 MAG: putative hydrolase of the alpha/beta-hydrolase fold [Marinobacter sp. HL-58]